MAEGTLRRIRFFDENEPPIAALDADRTSGPVPLTVRFDASVSDDPDSNDPLSFSWDLDGDGDYGDAGGPTPTKTYTTPGTYLVRVRVRDTDDATGSASLEVTAGNNPPVPTITAPTAPLGFAVGDVVTFAGSAVDVEDGLLPASALTWSLAIEHCPGDCHTHEVEDFEGVSGGSFVAPEHEVPSHLVLRLTATDSGGLTTSVEIALEPRTVALLCDSMPQGLTLGAGPTAEPTPFTRTTPVGSTTQVSAPSSQTLDGKDYQFVGWSDGGASTHDVVAGETSASLVASYASGCQTDGECGDGDPCTDDRCAAGRCTAVAKVCQPPDECHESTCDVMMGDCETAPITLDETDCLLRTALSGVCDRDAMPRRLARRLVHHVARTRALLTKAAVTSEPRHERRRLVLERWLRRLQTLTTTERLSRRLDPDWRARLGQVLEEILATSPALPTE